MSLDIELTETKICPGCRLPRPDRPAYRLSKFCVYDCPKCGLRYIDPSLTDEQQMLIYQNSELLQKVNGACSEYYEYDVLNPTSRTFRDYEKALNSLERLATGRRLVEIGCGAGSFLKYAKSRGWQVSGIDSSAENTQVLRLAGIDVIEGDAFKMTEPGLFDAVILWDVIEHPRNPGALLEVCKKLAAPGTLLLIATPCYPNLLSLLAGFFYRISFGKIRAPLEKMYMLEHITYFSSKTLSQVLERHGWVKADEWKTETDLDRYQFSAIVRLGLKAAFGLAAILGLQNRLIYFCHSSL